MAWNISTAKRRALVALQLRDKKGRWIEMGGGVKWYSSRLKKNVAGTVVGTKGENALVRMNKDSDANESLVQVAAHNIEVIESKASIPTGDGKSSLDTPEFETPEAVGTDSKETYTVTNTPDGNIYVSRNDGSELYSPARELQVGDEIVALDGADPSKPFSIGRSWVTKKAERLNNEGPKFGKVVSISGDRYAVVQMAGGHTVMGRDGEETDTVTVGLSNRVIKATPGLRDALRESMGEDTFAEWDTADDEEITDEDLANSDHVGREVPEDQLDAPPVPRDAAPQAPAEEAPVEEAPKEAITSFRVSDRVAGEIQFAIETQEASDNDPGLRLDGNRVEVYDLDKAIFAVDGPLDILDDNLDDGVYSGEDLRDAKAKQKGLQKLKDSLVARKGEEARTSEEADPEAPAAPSEPVEAPSDVQKPENVEAPSETAPSAPETAPVVEAPEEPAEAPVADPTPENEIVDGVSRVAQDMEDITEASLAGDELRAALEEATYSFTGNDGKEYTVSGNPEGDGEYSYNVTDADGKDVGNWNAGSYDSPEEIANDIIGTVNRGSKPEPQAENTPSEESAAPQPSYNENGLTEDEQRSADAYVRMANREYDSFNDAAGDRYRGLADELFKKGEARKASGESEAPQEEPAPSAPEETVPEAPAESQFLNGYTPESDSEIKNPRKNPEGADGFDYTVDSTSMDFLRALPVGSVLQTNDPERRDHGRPYVKVGESHWMEDPGHGDVARDIDHDDMYMYEDVPQGLYFPGNEKNPFSEADVERLRGLSRRGTDSSAPNTETAPAPVNEAPEAPQGAPEASQESLASIFVGNNAASRMLREAIDNSTEDTGLRMSSDGNIEVTDFDKGLVTARDVLLDSQANSGTSRNSQITANQRTRALSGVVRRIEDKQTEHNASSPEETTTPAAPERTPESSPVNLTPSDTGDASNFKLRVERDPSTSLSTPVMDERDLMTDEESAEFQRLAGDFLYAQHTNSRGRESVALKGMKNLENRVRARLAEENTPAPTSEEPVQTPESVPMDAPTEIAPGIEPFDGRGLKEPVVDLERERELDRTAKEAEERQIAEEQPPLASEEEYGRLYEALTSENPLPEGIERHVPEAVEGESFPPTQQQQDVIDAVLGGLNTLVQAKAGAGKTSTLRAIARRLKLAQPDTKVGYIAFNKSVQLEAESSMPNNVEPRTGHSIAYAWAPSWMKTRADDRNALRRPSDVADHLGIYDPINNNGKAFSPTDQAMAVTRTIDTYANSAEDRIDTSHLPDSVKGMPEDVQDAIVKYAEQAWQDLSSRDGRMRMTLDHMRKHWALSRPDFSVAGSGLRRPVNVLFLDEAQDTPPVLAKVVADQHIQKVIVGDADQAIYGFTGATDYLSNAEGDVELPLNKSWRFGPEVADMGNRFLQLLKSRGRVIGGGKSAVVSNMRDADAVLVRSNGGLLGEISKELENGRTVGVPKGTKKDLESLIASARYIRGEGYAPAKLHDDLAAFRTWSEFIDEEEKGDDQNLSKIRRMVETFGLDGMEDLVSRIVETGDVGLEGVTFQDTNAGLIAGGNTWAVASMTARGERTHFSTAGFRWMDHPEGVRATSGRNRGQILKVWVATGTPDERERKLAKLRELAGTPKPDVVISTAHKSKGLEWERVRIGDDFRGPKENEKTGEVEMPDADELRLAYVAVTRAEKELDPGSLGWVVDYTDENGGLPDTGTVNAPEAPEKEAPSLQEADESSEEVAPSMDTTEEEPAAPEVPEDQPEEVQAPEVPEPVEAPEEIVPSDPAPSEEFDFDGLNSIEQNYLSDLENRLAEAYRGNSEEDINFLEGEIDGLLRHGEARLAGETRDEYVPAQQATEAAAEAEEDLPEPVEKFDEVVPQGKRPRTSYNGEIVSDSAGNPVNTGDIVGHRRFGPVRVTGVLGSSQRIKFINPQTGLESSVAAHLVTRIDSNSLADPSVDVPEDLPTEPGSIIVDSATGKKGFIDQNGTKVLVGDTVLTRDGRTATVKATYTGNDGKASVAVDFGDGRRPYPRSRGALLQKQDTSSPEEVPSVPETVEPVSTPEIVEAPSESVTLPTVNLQDADVPARVRRRATMVGAPVGTEIDASNGNYRMIKVGEDQWISSTDTNSILNTDDVLYLVERGETRGNSYVIRFPKEEQADSSVPEAPETPQESTDAPEVSAEAPSGGTVLTGNFGDHLNAVGLSPVGSRLKSDLGDEFVKTGDNEWTLVGTGARRNNAEMARLTSTGLSEFTLTGAPATDLSTPAGRINSGLSPDRFREIESSPIGTVVENGFYRFEKTGQNEWTNQNGTRYSSGEMAMVTSPHSAFGGNWDVTSLSTPAAPPARRFPTDSAVGAFMPSQPNSTSGVKKVGDNQWEMMVDGQPTGRIIDNDAASVIFDLTGMDVQAPTPKGYGLADFGGEGKTFGDYLMENNDSDGGTSPWTVFRGNGPLPDELKAKLNEAYTRFVSNVNKALPEGFSAELAYDPVISSGGQLDTKIYFYKDGRQVGFADRKFGLENIFGIKRARVYHAYFTLDSNIQGSGLNKAFLSESMKLYKEMGLDAVRVTANINVGGFTWARSGFNWLTPSTMQNIFALGESKLESIRRRKFPRIGDEEWGNLVEEFRAMKARATAENFANGTAPTAAELASLGWNSTIPSGRDSMWLGKAILLGEMWDGVQPVESGRDLRAN